MILLTTAVVLIAIVCGLHLLLTFGLIVKIRELRQLGGIQARDPNLPRPGAVVGPFTLTDTDGATITAADLDGAVHFGFFSVGCAPCVTLSEALVADPPAAPFVAVVDGDPVVDNTRQLVAKLAQLGRVVIIDIDDPVLSAFGVSSFPALVHTHSGVVTAAGSRLHHFAGALSPVA